jgi:hypothetical protein
MIAGGMERALLLALFFMFAALYGVLLALSRSAVQAPRVAEGQGRPKWLRRWARAGVAVVGLAVLVPMGVVYCHMLYRAPPPECHYPAANAYPRVVDLANEARSLNWSQWTIADLRSVGDSGLADQLETLCGELLKVADEAGYVPVDFARAVDSKYQEANWFEERDGISRLANMLSAEVDAAVQAKQFDKAADYGAASLQIGSMLGRGGLIMHSSVGGSVESVGPHDLNPIRNEISIPQARRIVLKLQRVERRREPFDVTVARDRAWKDRVSDWLWHYRRAIGWIAGFDEHELYEREFETDMGHRDAMLRLLMTELVIRLFRNDHGRLPESLDELAPQYVSAPPIDPFSGGLQIFRRTDDGYLLYSVGPDGVDDGGRFTTLQDVALARGTGTRIRFDIDAGAYNRSSQQTPAPVGTSDSAGAPDEAEE